MITRKEFFALPANVRILLEAMRSCLADLVEKHDEEPSMLTEQEWNSARALLLGSKFQPQKGEFEITSQFVSMAMHNAAMENRAQVIYYDALTGLNEICNLDEWKELKKDLRTAHGNNFILSVYPDGLINL